MTGDRPVPRDAPAHTGSASIEQPDYWWYRARAALLEAALAGYLEDPALVLDVGSADGPSVAWMRRAGTRIAADLDPRGLAPGRGVRASAMALPFPDAVFDVVGAFDVIEHCEPEQQAVAELVRVLRPGGRLLVSVPAYQWAWSHHDTLAGHHRRYTRPRLVRAVERAGLRVERATYGFAAVFPLFAAERLSRRVRRGEQPAEQRLPQVPSVLDRLLVRLSLAEARVLRDRDLPFGSSVFLAARKPS